MAKNYSPQEIEPKRPGKSLSGSRGKQKTYRPWEIEPKWQKIWEENKLFYQAKDSGAKKFYALVEFPYPSGEGLHMGHAFTNVILDVFARKKRAEGFNLLHPMGWDAFGLPTENYAIKTGIHPAVVTQRNTKKFKEQDQRLALSYNWEREINTSAPQYYRWTQWIFLQLLKHGLAYKAETPVGWCPACKIILANEEIVAGKCERCGHEAERRQQSQWLLKITAYADRLADELDLVDYPDYVKTSQRNWIGRSEGVIISYPVLSASRRIISPKLSVECYSTRPDTNFGATFVVIAPEHPLLRKLKIKNCLPAGKAGKLKIEVENYIKKSRKRSELERTALGKEKTGVFTGFYALNRLTGKKMPIWVADFVVLTAGTGIVVGVPAHDERDWQFAKKYGLEIVPVIKPHFAPKFRGYVRGREWDFEKAPFTEIENGVVFNSDFLNGLTAVKAKEKITDYLVAKGWGRRAKNYHLRNWVFSRQRYWGEPIPIIFCSKCGMVPVPEDQLPVRLPQVEKYQPTNTGESPLANIKNWVNVACPECGGAARRETDTMPNWAGSSWYFLRYCDVDNNSCLSDPKRLRYWLPVDLYLGGAEHTTLHLLYSRFWHKFLNDIGVVPGKEPYAARRQHGVILGEDGFRMSKSRGNIINPEDVVEKFGADTLRLYLMFMGTYDSTMSWNTKGLEGCWRFLNRVWRVCRQKDKVGAKTSPELASGLHRLIKKVGEDIEALKYNTAIAAMMEFLNEWQAGLQDVLSKRDAGIFLQLLAPFAPYLAEELWSATPRSGTPRRGWKSIHQQPWPKYDPRLIKEETTTIVVQINGKLRGQIKVQSPKSKVQSQVEKLAKKKPRVAKYLAGKKIKKTIFIPGKLINFVI